MEKMVGKISRRQLLSRAGIGAASLSLPIAGIASGENNRSGANTPFSASDTDALRSFLQRVNEKEKEKQYKMIDKLTPRQQEAVREFLKGEKIEVSKVQAPSTSKESSKMGTLGYDGYTSRTATHWIALTNSFGDQLWRNYQVLEYDWWYKVDVRITYVDTYPEIYYPLWSYLGELNHNQEDFGTYADSYTQDSFQACFPTQCGDHVNPYMNLRCYSKAGWRVEYEGITRF